MVFAQQWRAEVGSEGTVRASRLWGHQNRNRQLEKQTENDFFKEKEFFLEDEASESESTTGRPDSIRFLS